MKKTLVMMVVVISILSACRSSQLGVSKVENVPQNVLELIDSSLQLQLVNVDKKGPTLFFSHMETLLLI
ncbi:hypothetical protein [Sporosarcina sp. NPDC096371]|uniref:hypothetical protein n=1 Tax=Sporosarcina sp. NPDC096371 TaxID=3364530 RepID=UPI003811B72D